MLVRERLFSVGLLIFLLSAFNSGGVAQKKAGKSAKPTAVKARPVMWEKVDVARQDLFWGPGGKAMRPDLRSVQFIKEQKNGHNKKYRIRDHSGREWVAKFGTEAKPETAAVRLLYGLGYKTEINYLVPRLTIPGKGTFTNVRLEARRKNADRLEEWEWMDNPFVGSPELQGLKIMMVFMTNYDVLDLQNKVVRVGDELQYIVSDLGATFGKLGNNNLPFIFRLGRSTGKPEDFIKTQLIREVEGNEIELSYKGKSREVFKGITVRDAKWLSNLLNQLSDRQIADAFRAANFTPAEVAMYVRASRSKIEELDRVANGLQLAESRR